MKRKYQILLASVIIIFPLIFLAFASHGNFLQRPALLDGAAFENLESYTRANVPLMDSITELGLSIRVFGGQREYNRIFISGDELIPAIDLPSTGHSSENSDAVLSFAERGIPTYCMIIPTVSAIRQQSLPPFSEAQLFNQKQFIEETYSEMIGRASVIDVYPTLFSAREQYIYYRTEDTLAALGGFYVYSVLAPRLLEGISRPALSDYNIEYVMGGYFGNLYEQSPFQGARADILHIYRYTGAPREYFLEKKGGDFPPRAYNTLYPIHLAALGSPLDIYLGGHCAVTTVTSNSPYNNRLLVFGDRGAVSWLPFIANHYRTVTLVDLSLLVPSDYAQIDVLSYDQVLFAYGIETYMHRSDAAKAMRLLPAEDE